MSSQDSEWDARRSAEHEDKTLLRDSKPNTGCCAGLLKHFDVWYKNPMYYVSLLLLLFSIFVLVIHAQWKYWWGISFSSLCFVISGFLIYRILWPIKRAGPKTKTEKIKTVIWVIFIILIHLLGATYQIVLLKIHIGSPDPDFQTFPVQCSTNAANLPIINCVRVGIGISDPHTDYSTGAIQPPMYNAPLLKVQQAFEEVASSSTKLGMGCSIITSRPGFTHLRCLSLLLGFADDLVLQYQCESKQNTTVWIHSQSRSGVFDFNMNDYRVRLLLSYIELARNWCTGIEVDPAKAWWTCLSQPWQTGTCSK